MKPRHLCSLLILLFLFMSCSETPRYTIGVSQCSDDGWRKKVNREIRIGQYQYGDVEVRITNADNKDDRQVRQIDSLVREKVDFLWWHRATSRLLRRPLTGLTRAGFP